MVKRVLTISKPYVCRPYRKKLELLARDSRFEVGLICPEVWGTQKFEPQEIKNTDSKASLWVKALPTYFSSKNHFHLYKDLQKTVEEFAPDIVNVEEEDYSMVTWQAFRLAKKIGAKPMFYAWQNIYKDYPPPFSNIEHYIYRHAAAAMGGSMTAGEILKRKGYDKPFYSIPQIGIDTSLFHIEGDIEKEKMRLKTAIGLDPEKFVVFYGGRIVQEKGIQTLIEAAAHLRRADLHVVVIGSGSYHTELRRMAAKIPEKNITFIPYVTASEMPNYIKAADALCLASLTRPNWKEQGPVRIVTESMAAHTVAVVSNSGELPEVVGDDGIVFPEGDVKSLAHHLTQLLDQPDLVKTLRTRGYAKVLARYSAQVVASQCADVFMSL
jgi:glycosyltransferase involved in cell wall biosynthesis